MDGVYKRIHAPLKEVVRHCELEHGMYALGTLEPEWSSAQAAKYEAVLLVLRAALALGELLFGKEKV